MVRRPQTEDRPDKKETEMEMANRGDEMTWSRETYPKKEKIARSEEKDLSIPDLTYTTHIASSMKCERSEEWWWVCDYRFFTNVDMSYSDADASRIGYVWCVGDVVVVIVAVIVSLSVPPPRSDMKKKKLDCTPTRAMGPWPIICTAADKPHHTHTFMSKYRVIIG